VSGGVWSLSAAVATWYSPDAAILALVVGATFTFPITQLLFALYEATSFPPKGHPMNGLAMQVAFALPFHLPLVFAATAHHKYSFYPALMIALGAHYLPFIFLYGMWQFGGLAAVLIVSGGHHRDVSSDGIQLGWLVDQRDTSDLCLHRTKRGRVAQQ
jgi:hypothetical protein